ncbi:ATP-binding protein [Albimonas sp. CAU 1670]|uniref:ATP-binding protein n=1 Tax=Albimonas sp. CAU 1670 TaxID=3032599 RepID=UPI0023DB88B2|nr:ATP-binding protein [Albimonas sp. CAU 1670]MDF2233950.1 ATP-binding protein [Albimonas sp. CAU 1670]
MSGPALRLVLANDLAEVGRLAEAVEAFCEAQDLPMGAAHALALSLDELLTNTIGYGYEDGATGRIEVSITLSDGAATAVVRDDARPFDPTGAEAPDVDAELDDRAVGGLGIHLVQSMMDEVAYARRDGINEVTLVKRLDG